MQTFQHSEADGQKKIARRRLVALAIGVGIVVPAAYGTSLLIEGNQLASVALPEPVLVNGWVLDRQDITEVQGIMDTSAASLTK